MAGRSKIPGMLGGCLFSSAKYGTEIKGCEFTEWKQDKDINSLMVSVTI